MAHPSLKLERIGVVMLGVKDLKRSVAFYRDVLGLPLQQEVPDDFAFFGGNVMLALSVGLAKNSPAMVGATEVSVPDVTAAYQALLAKGVPFIRPPRVVAPPNWAANFTDPDGHRLSIFGPQHAS